MSPGRASRPAGARAPSATAIRRLERWLEKAARRRAGMPAPQVLVRAPGLDLEFGELNRPFHAASVGKLMTATLVAMLAGEGRAGFEAPIGSLLPPADLAGLPAAPGVDLGRDVTVEHLLAHTSGLPDYFEPPGGARTAASLTALAADPGRRWTPADLLAETRGLPATGRPGERFHYADTGYILLGRIVEEVGGQPFADALQARILGPAGMTASGTPYDATRIPDDLSELDVAPFWLGEHELSRAHCVSADWAGGGVVATAEDLVRFQRALHAGELIAHERLAHLTRVRHRLRRGIHYGAGAMELRFGEFFPLLRRLEPPVGHLGVLSTHLFHHPRADAHVVLNFHATGEMSRSFRAHIAIARLLAGSGRA